MAIFRFALTKTQHVVYVLASAVAFAMAIIVLVLLGTAGLITNRVH